MRDNKLYQIVKHYKTTVSFLKAKKKKKDEFPQYIKSSYKTIWKGHCSNRKWRKDLNRQFTDI